MNKAHVFELVTIDVSSKNPKPLGAKLYQSFPRIGEWVEIEIDEVGTMFSVVMIAHSSSGHGSDVYIKHLSATPQAILSLCRSLGSSRVLVEIGA